jgi:hypothetical protein
MAMTTGFENLGSGVRPAEQPGAVGVAGPYPGDMRRNTMLALMLLLAAIALAGVLGVIRIYQMTGG